MGIAAPDAARVARDLYLRSVDADPEYAPAWARLGRCHRVLAKAGEDLVANAARAERCFDRALELNPDLGVAHALYAMVECDLGKGRDAMVRLLERGRGGNTDAELFAGLVRACRYSGLLPPSIAAHERARALDPQVLTSVRERVTECQPRLAYQRERAPGHATSMADGLLAFAPTRHRSPDAGILDPASRGWRGWEGLGLDGRGRTERTSPTEPLVPHRLPSPGDILVSQRSELNELSIEFERPGLELP